MNRQPEPFVHPMALCESETVGPGTRIWAFAHVLKGAVIGVDCNIGDHAYVEGGAVIGDRVTVKNHVMVWDRVTIEDDVFLGPNAVLTNDRVPRVENPTPPEDFLPTLIRKGATIGANATVVCGVTIGTQAFVGAGTVVIDNVPAHALVVGNPARLIGWVCRCGDRLSEGFECACGNRYRYVSPETGLVPAVQ